MKHHPGVAKARIQIPSNGVVTPSAANSNNIASVTDTGTGNRSIVIATDFSNTTWAALGSSGDNSQFTTALQDYAAGSITLQAYQAGTLTDCRQAFAGFGDQ